MFSNLLHLVKDKDKNITLTVNLAYLEAIIFSIKQTERFSGDLKFSLGEEKERGGGGQEQKDIAFHQYLIFRYHSNTTIRFASSMWLVGFLWRKPSTGCATGL